MAAPRTGGQTPFRHTEILEVFVGSENRRTIFYVYPYKICTSSPFFEAACSRWKRAGEPVVLSDDDAEIFQAYLDYVYDRVLPKQTSSSYDEDDGIAASADFEKLSAVYILADKLGDLATANAFIDECIRQSQEQNCIPSVDVAVEVWEATPDNSPLRRLLVDFYIHESDSATFDEVISDLPPTFIQAFARTLKTLSWEDSEIGVKAVNRPKCYYHQHNNAFPTCDSEVNKWLGAQRAFT